MIAKLLQPIAVLLRWLNRHREGRVGRKFLSRLGRACLPGGAVARNVVVGNGFRMTLELDTYPDGAIYFDAFEHTTCEVLRRVLEPGATFVDVGANIGFFSLMAARLVGESGRVFAFEPNPAVLRRLRLASDANGCAHIMRIRQYGLGAQPGEAELFVPLIGGEGLASIRPQSMDGTWLRHRISLHCLDDEEELCEGLRLVKIDVEGAEMLVLRGGQRLLKRCRPHVVCEVNEATARVFGYTPLDIVRFFVEEIGAYRVHALTSRKIIHDVPISASMVPAAKLENWWFEPRRDEGHPLAWAGFR